MISPEFLRRYPVFGSLDNEQLKKVSMIAENDVVKQGETIFSEVTKPIIYISLQMEL